MCDYSLEMYHSRPARQGERYVTQRFTSSTVGFIEPGQPEVAVCMASDTTLELSDVPAELQQMIAIRPGERVTFTRIEHGLHKDAVRLASGTVVSLQQLGPGVTARVIDAMAENAVLPAREVEMA